MAALNRRHFLKYVGVGALGLGPAKSVKPFSKAEAVSQAEMPVPKIQKYNNLGKTGLRVSDVGFGAINYFNPNVLRYAYNLGVNYFDTAESYMRTMSETYNTIRPHQSLDYQTPQEYYQAWLKEHKPRVSLM